MTDYVAYEAVPVIQYSEGDCEAIYDPERHQNIVPSFWTVYGRRWENGYYFADALIDADAPSERDDQIAGIEAVTGMTVTRYNC